MTLEGWDVTRGLPTVEARSGLSACTPGRVTSEQSSVHRELRRGVEGHAATTAAAIHRDVEIPTGSGRCESGARSQPRQKKGYVDNLEEPASIKACRLSSGRTVGAQPVGGLVQWREPIKLGGPFGTCGPNPPRSYLLRRVARMIEEGDSGMHVDCPFCEDQKRALVGDSSAWTRARYLWTALAILGIVAAFLLLAKYGGWN